VHAYQGCTGTLANCLEGANHGGGWGGAGFEGAGEGELLVDGGVGVVGASLGGHTRSITAISCLLFTVFL